MVALGLFDTLMVPEVIVAFPETDPLLTMQSVSFEPEKVWLIVWLLLDNVIVFVQPVVHCACAPPWMPNMRHAKTSKTNLIILNRGKI